VVLLHGFGAPGTDLVPLGRLLGAPAGTRFVFPEAPLSLSPLGYGEGRAWWMIDLDRPLPRDRSGEQPERLPQVRAQIGALLDELPALLGPAAERPVLGGFSQGAMLACDVALHRARRPAGLVLLSGTLLCEDVWRARAGELGGLAVLQSHGRHDELLDFAAAERLRDLLCEGGAELTWIEFSGGHEIPQRVLAELSAFLHRTTGQGD
jgi:phospholipase/carboxylesterase